MHAFLMYSDEEQMIIIKTHFTWNVCSTNGHILTILQMESEVIYIYNENSVYLLMIPSSTLMFTNI